MFNFENLEVWKRSIKLAKEIIGETKNIDRKNYAIIDQLTRAVISISTNIAEGSGRVSKNDRNYFWSIARGSIYEVVSLIKLSGELSIIGKGSVDKYYRELEEIAKMISKLIK